MKLRKLLLCIFLLSTLGLKAQLTSEKQVTTRLNHIALSVFNLEKSKDFYEYVLQLKRIPEPFKDGLHEWFAIGDAAQLHIIQGAKSINVHEKATHLCFSVPSIDDFITHLKKYQIGFINWKGDSNQPTIRVDGVKQIYFTDPDGYWIEVNDSK